MNTSAAMMLNHRATLFCSLHSYFMNLVLFVEKLDKACMLFLALYIGVTCRVQDLDFGKKNLSLKMCRDFSQCIGCSIFACLKQGDAFQLNMIAEF